jgi:signal transduction histidine kinase
MYHRLYIPLGGNEMTIKRRLFLTNIRTVVISIISFPLVANLTRIFFTKANLNRDFLQDFFESQSMDFRTALILFNFFLAMIIIGLLNNYLTLRITKRIVKPLEPLNEGVRHIQANNLTYRIDYQDNDEFRPVCDAFDDMVLKLETSTALKKKDEANRRELIAGISHDLLTPLTSIIVSVEGLEKGVASTPEKQEKYHTFIKNEASSMKHIIQQLFLFSKLDMEEFPLNMMNIDISLAISEMLEDSLVGYENRGLAIHLSDMPKDVIVRADVFLLRNVVINIIENSIKYKAKEHGKMEISAEVAENNIFFRFADDGPGVEPDMLAKLLDVFYRTDPSRTGHGSGLGLPISAKIIQSMGGTIDAELPSSGGLVIVIGLPLLQGETK